MLRKIKSALISVYHKEGLGPIVALLHKNSVTIYSTGGTEKFIASLGVPVIPVEQLTSYPSIFDGRVKTLHPAIFGGILYRRELEEDVLQAEKYGIPSIDMVIVDLYPFEETVALGASQEEIVEKIDIGGISLIRATAKNFKDTLIVASRSQYDEVLNLLASKLGATDLEDRIKFAQNAYEISSGYDTSIFNWFASKSAQPANSDTNSLRNFENLPINSLRYGENPHQKGVFYGDLNAMFEQLNGKELSYNNLVDVDACVALIDEFDISLPTFAIIKHTNACGLASAKTPKQAYVNALAADPVSAFGGVVISNTGIDRATAEELHKLFMEILIAPSFDDDALTLLRSKKNRIILKRKRAQLPKDMFKTVLNGVLMQEKDLAIEGPSEMKIVTRRPPDTEELLVMEFALKICKHSKSNTIVLARNGQLLASGTGQTSRVDALRQAIVKAKSFNFDLSGAVMASDAFFPFPDCVEIANKAGIKTVVQPGGSVRDGESIAYCNANDMAMVTTGVRHFKH